MSADDAGPADGVRAEISVHVDAEVQRHHIRHYAHGGPTALENLVELCWFHHRAVHEGGARIALGPGGTVTVTRPDGTALTALPSTIDPVDGGIEARNAAAGVRITASTAIPAWYGDRLDLDHAMTGWLHGPGGPYDVSRPRRS